jgi:hypothetical protein
MSRSKTLFLILSLFVGSQPLSIGQQQESSSSPADSSSQTNASLGDVAKEAKKRKEAVKTHAKKLITNEELGSSHGPLPAMKFNEDNSGEVIDAIERYHGSHTPQETEDAVRKWYDEYDEVLAAAIRQNTAESARRSDTIYNGYWGCEDSPNYETCVVRRRTESRGLHDDQWAQRNDGYTVGHIQTQFMTVRSAIARFGLRYSWFKVRNPNGQGSF